MVQQKQWISDRLNECSGQHGLDQRAKKLLGSGKEVCKTASMVPRYWCVNEACNTDNENDTQRPREHACMRLLYE